jgi:hypothetical protein
MSVRTDPSCNAAWTALHEWVYYARRARRAVRRLLHRRAARALRVWIYVLDERQVSLQPLMTLIAFDGIGWPLMASDDL